MNVDRLTGLLGQFELDGATTLSLADGCSVDRVAMWSNILDSEADDTATAKFAVDRKIEQLSLVFDRRSEGACGWPRRAWAGAAALHPSACLCSKVSSFGVQLRDVRFPWSLSFQRRASNMLPVQPDPVITRLMTLELTSQFDPFWSVDRVQPFDKPQNRKGYVNLTTASVVFLISF